MPECHPPRPSRPTPGLAAAVWILHKFRIPTSISKHVKFVLTRTLQRWCMKYHTEWLLVILYEVTPRRSKRPISCAFNAAGSKPPPSGGLGDYFLHQTFNSFHLDQKGHIKNGSWNQWLKLENWNICDLTSSNWHQTKFSRLFINIGKCWHRYTRHLGSSWLLGCSNNLGCVSLALSHVGSWNGTHRIGEFFCWKILQ